MNLVVRLANTQEAYEVVYGTEVIKRVSMCELVTAGDPKRLMEEAIETAIRVVRVRRFVKALAEEK